MKVVYKYPLEVTGTQVVMLSRYSHILSIQVQGGTVCMWAVVDPEADKIGRLIQCRGTGHPMGNCSDIYIATIQQGEFVWHFFDGGEVRQ